MIKSLKNMAELFGVVFLRFKFLPRAWCVWLVGINAASLYFIGSIEGQVVLGVTAIAVALQTWLYGKIGFTRILGVGHVFWIPMFAWMATRMDSYVDGSALTTWLMLLLMTNIVSLLIDAVDAFRYVMGEREPHYTWSK